MAGRTAILIVNGFDRVGIWGTSFDQDDAVRYPWIDVCLREVERRSRASDYQVLVWDNSQIDSQREAIVRSGARLYPGDEELGEARIRQEPLSLVRLHMGALHTLLAKVGPEFESVITLDTDAFPIRDGWIEELTGNLEHASLTGVWRDEMPDVLEPFVHPSCLCIRRERLRRVELPFSFGGVQDVGQRITFDIRSAGERIEPLRRSNARNAHFLMGGIYGDLVYHHSAGSRKPVFRMTLGSEREDSIHMVLREAVFHDLDHLVAVLRGQSDDDLGLDWGPSEPVASPGMEGVLGNNQEPPASGETQVPQTPEELAALEARYEPFQGAADWHRLRVDTERWDRYASDLRRAAEAAGDERVSEVADRLAAAAALDSGALAGLFPPNPELTTGVLEGAFAKAPADLGEVGGAMRIFVECNRRALGLAADAAAEGRLLDENFIAMLEDVLTQAQATFTVEMPGGKRVEVELPRHQYKPVSNFVTLNDGRLVAFCPVARVPEEMERLVGELASADFNSCHPAIQAAYAHYAITAMHPFADANGRLARVVASIFLYRSVGVPLLVFADQWPQYRRSQNDLSMGNLQLSLDRFTVFGLNAMDLAASLMAAHPRSSVARLAGGEVPADERELAAVALVHDLLWIELHDMLPTPPAGVALAIGELRDPPAAHAGHHPVTDPRSGRSGVRLSIRAGAGQSVDLVFVPLLSNDDHDLLPIAIREQTTGRLFEAALGDVHPFPLEGLMVRLRAWVASLLEGSLSQAAAADR